MSMSLSQYVSANKTIQSVIFKDQEIKSPKIKHHCVMRCGYICRNTGLGNSTCDCPKGYRTLTNGYCWKMPMVKEAYKEQENKMVTYFIFGEAYEFEQNYFIGLVISVAVFVFFVFAWFYSICL